MSHVVVVGAGLAGLAAACHLVKDGHRVTIVEGESFPGGRNGRLEKDGFTFDTGPSVLTMVELIDEALNAVGSSVAETLQLSQLDPAYRAIFADGSTLHVRNGHEAMREEILSECGSTDAKAFDEFVSWLEKLYVNEMPNFIDKNFDSPLGLFSNPKAALDLVRLGGFDKLGSQIRKRFKDERLHRIFSFQAMYAGLAPDQALAIYAVITYMDSVKGVWFPEGGMRRVPEVMADALIAKGAEFQYDTWVSQISCRPGGAANGVILSDGSRLDADAVVCTLDLPVAYDKFLPHLKQPRALKNPAYSPSALVWHVGVKGTIEPPIAHHNIHFGEAWAGAFDDLLKHGRRMQDPSRFVCVPSKNDADAAPEGHSTLYVLEPTPNLDVGKIDWKKEAPGARDDLLKFLDVNGYPTEIVTEELVTPEDWRDQGMAAGTPFALAHTFAQTGPFRPKNIDRQIPGLVFAGSGTTPGVGIPMVLISGKLAAQRVNQALR